MGSRIHISGPNQFRGAMKTVVSQVLATAAGVVLCQPNNNRFVLMLGTESGGNVVNVQPAIVPTGAQGIPLGFQQGWLELVYSLHGCLVQEQWWALASAGPFNVTVIEGIWLPEVQV